MADRELDAQIAVTLFGYRWVEISIQGDPPIAALLSQSIAEPRLKSYPDSFKLAKSDTKRAGDWDSFMPHFSTSIVDAWQVVDRMYQDFESFSLVRRRDGLWMANFHNPHEGTGSGCGIGQNAPCAICKAALEAVDR